MTFAMEPDGLSGWPVPNSLSGSRSAEPLHTAV